VKAIKGWDSVSNDKTMIRIWSTLMAWIAQQKTIEQNEEEEMRKGVEEIT
jgi:hypothetical protein